MEKKRVWMAFCTVMIVLLTSTVFSLRIENLMKLRVNTCVVVKDEELTFEHKERSDDQEIIGRLPLSCYQWDKDSEYMVFYVEKREGLFGEEFVAAKKSVYLLYEEGNKAIVFMNGGLGTNGKPLKIVSEVSCSREIREGDLLIVDQEDMVDPLGQIRNLSCLAAIMIPGIILLIESVKKFGLLKEGSIRAGIEGVIYVLIWVCGIFWLTGNVQIPRQYLPPECIFDIPFYLNECKEFHVWSTYKRELLAAGGFVLLIWVAAIAVSFFVCRNKYSKKMRKANNITVHENTTSQS